jgi:hypothetical protein
MLHHTTILSYLILSTEYTADIMKFACLSTLFLLAGTTVSTAFIVSCPPTHKQTLASSSTSSSLLLLHPSSADSDSIKPRENNDHHSTTSMNRHMNRSQFFTKSLSTISAAILSTSIALTSPPAPAHAAYGSSPNVALPSYIEFLIEKNTSADNSKSLYKGADTEVQIKRISDAVIRLNEIPKIAHEKKWSQVQGILLGPLGTLGQTMNGLVKACENSDAAKKAAGKVKADIILIGQEAGKKNEAGIVKGCEEAQKDLEAFAKLVF